MKLDQFIIGVEKVLFFIYFFILMEQVAVGTSVGCYRTLVDDERNATSVHTYWLWLVN
jgi:hypothetical protein